MTEVTFPEELGGSGRTFDDTAGPNGMAEGGYLENFFPCLQDVVAVSAGAASNAQLAQDAAVTAVNAPGTQATTTTAVTVGTGSKSITLAQSGKAFAKSMRVHIASDANVANFVEGVITAFSGTAMTVNVDTIGGSGSFSDGIVTFAGGGGVPATRQFVAAGLVKGGGDFSANRTFTVDEATPAHIRAGTRTDVVVTPGDQALALAEVTLQCGANITTQGDAVLDGSKFTNARVVMTGDTFLPNLANVTPGTYRIIFVQDATGNRKLTGWGSMYRAQGGKPILSVPPGAIDWMEIDVANANEALVGFVRAPTN